MAHSTVTFLTRALGRPVTCDVIFPTDKMLVPNEYVPEPRPMKTLYFLEGLLGTYLGPNQYTRMQALAEDYNICVVMITGDNKWYADSKKTGDYYDTLVARDIVDFTRRTFNLSPKREDTFIGGFSMGGFGTTNFALLYPELFSYAIVISPALNKFRFAAAKDEPNINDMLTRENYALCFGLDSIDDFEGCRYDYDLNVKKLAESGKPKPKFFIGAGSKETHIYNNANALGDELEENGFIVKRNLVEGTGHSWLSLEYNLAKALEWMQKEGAIDGFRGNLAEYPFSANFSDPEKHYLCNWTTYYELTK